MSKNHSRKGTKFTTQLRDSWDVFLVLFFGSFWGHGTHQLAMQMVPARGFGWPASWEIMSELVLKGQAKNHQ